MKTKKKKTVINKQKVFSFISFIFIIICTIWYGSRTIYFYLDSKKQNENKDNLLAQTIIEKNYNKNNFKKINNDYYFYNNAKNNYLIFSNMLFRIIKVTKDNNIVLISEDSLTSLAFGENKTLKNSYITKWLNDKNKNSTGIFEKNIDNKQKYLTKTETCIDNIDNMKKIKCTKQNKDNYFSLLSIVDYINTGSKKSFINDNTYTYLANTNSKNKIWYINTEGNLEKSDGTDIYGVKPTITLKSTTAITSGNGTKNSPYKIEEKNPYFASYVKLDNDIYRVYSVEDNLLKLSLNDYLKLNNEPIEYNYSNNNYYHNDTTYGTLAYYLNHRVLNRLTYSNIIKENNYPNIYYGAETNYDYSTINTDTINTKIYTLSITDPILNNLEDYFLATGTDSKDSNIYLKKSNNTLEEIDVEDEAYIIPCISIDKSNLKKGSGTLEDPYRME